MVVRTPLGGHCQSCSILCSEVDGVGPAPWPPALEEGARGGDGPAAAAAAVQPTAEAKQSESAINRLGLDNRWMVTDGEGEKEGKRKVEGDGRWYVGGTTRVAGRGRGQEMWDGGRPHKKVLRDSFI